MVRQTFDAECTMWPFRRYPLAELQKMWGGAPFDTVFNYTHFHVYKSLKGMDGLKVIGARFLGQSHFPLRAEFNRDPFVDSIHLDLECDMQKISQSRLENIGGYYTRVLSAMAQNPLESHDAQAHLSESEKHLICTEWNDTSETHLKDRCIHQIFESQAACAPDRIAVAFGDLQMTFFELNARANKMAHYLRRAGVGPEVLVGIFMERSPEVIISILGILKAGGGYIPLDPDSPQGHIKNILESSHIGVILTHDHLSKVFSADAIETLCVERILDDQKTGCTENLATRVAPENVAYVIYTSGSTGEPKGVAVTHHNLVNSTHARTAYYRERVAKFLLVSPFFFDSSVAGIYWTLCQGGTLVLPGPGKERDVLHLADLIDRHEISHWLSIPSLYEILLEEAPEKLCSLRVVILAGEAFLAGLQLRHYEQLLDTKIFNEYGPTEATVWSLVHFVPPSGSEGSIPVGRPVANTKIYLLNAHQHPVCLRVPAELHIGGLNVARGYLNRPGLTAEKFIPDAWSKIPGNRLYKTGDLGRYVVDGNVEFLGRTDRQVKIQGHRIETEEIRSILRQHPGVRDAVVAAQKNRLGNDQLFAYVVRDNCYLGAKEQELRRTQDHVANWQSLFEKTYEDAVVDRTSNFNTTGWDSSYMRLPIPDIEMQEWVDQTVDRILGLHPERVLEIGCGTGLLLFHIAPHCSQYIGTEFSERVLKSLKQNLSILGSKADRVKVLNREASNFRGVDQASVDTVIINSVSQYFPTAHYFLDVLTKAAKAVEPGGRIFVGDVRDLRLLKAFHLSVEMQQASSSLPVAELRKKVRIRLLQEKELVIHPGFFHCLKSHIKQVTHVEILPKRGRHNNEMNRFRYDVTLHVDSQVSCGSADRYLDWQAQALTLPDVKKALEEGHSETVVVTSIPDKRVAFDLNAAECLFKEKGDRNVGAFREHLANFEAPEVDVENLVACANGLGYELSFQQGGEAKPGMIDAIFTYPSKGKQANPKAQIVRRQLEVQNENSLGAYTNNPLNSSIEVDLKGELTRLVENKLPKYMVPSHFVMLYELPLTPNGKVDYQKLPNPEQEVRLKKEKTDKILEKIASMSDEEVEELLNTLSP